MIKNLKNILIVRTDRIGDVVLSLPLAGLIKRHNPDCRVTFLVKNYTNSLVQNHPYIDDVIVLKEKKGKVKLFDNVKTISTKKFDAAIVVYPTFISSLIIFLSKIKNRVGTGYRWYSFFFNKKVYDHRKFAEKHELEFNVGLLAKLAVNETVDYSTVKFDLNVNLKTVAKVESILRLRNVDLDKEIIIVHPGSGGSAIDLPIDKFIELVKKLSGSGLQVLVTGNKNETEICNKLMVTSDVRNVAGLFNLEELTALISKSKIFISNSTGPLHIAAALGKHVVGFYPKILACSVERWGPYTSKKLVYVPEIDCKDCTRVQCENLNCMSSININKVFTDIQKII
jgi:lipopolysaccharide heptosyltransferase II